MRQDRDDVFRNLFRQYYPLLYTYAKSLIGEDEAEDVVEDVFAELWNRQDRMELGDHIQSWLYRSVYNRSLNVLKHRNVTSNYIALTEELNRQRMAYIDLYSPQRYLENQNLHEMLDAAIAELPEKCGEVFKLSYLGNMKNSEIAEALGISVKTVEAHMYKALKHLRMRLQGARNLLAFFFLFFILTK